MKQIATRFFLLLMGLLLAGYAVLAPLLRVVGTRTMGVITDVRRQGGERDEIIRNRYDYGVGFHFFLPDGRRIEGATTVVGSAINAGIAKGPAAVRYLPTWPRVHILERHARFSLGHLILFGVGAFLTTLALKRPKIRKRR
jgi:hypothetical protein